MFLILITFFYLLQENEFKASLASPLTPSVIDWDEFGRNTIAKSKQLPFTLYWFVDSVANSKDLAIIDVRRLPYRTFEQKVGRRKKYVSTEVWEITFQKQSNGQLILSEDRYSWAALYLKNVSEYIQQFENKMYRLKFRDTDRIKRSDDYLNIFSPYEDLTNTIKSTIRYTKQCIQNYQETLSYESHTAVENELRKIKNDVERIKLEKRQLKKHLVKHLRKSLKPLTTAEKEKQHVNTYFAKRLELSRQFRLKNQFKDALLADSISLQKANTPNWKRAIQKSIRTTHLRNAWFHADQHINKAQQFHQLKKYKDAVFHYQQALSFLPKEIIKRYYKEIPKQLGVAQFLYEKYPEN